MAELFREFPDLIQDPEGTEYRARVYGDETSSGRWTGWLAFVAERSRLLFETESEAERATKEELAKWAAQLGARDLGPALSRAREHERQRHGAA